jgi:phosphoglycolate phosphatase
VKLALFDLDGTLIDSEIGIVASIEYALQRLGASAPPREELRSWIGPPLRMTFPRVLGEDAATVERAVEFYRERYSATGWSEHVAYAGVAEAVAALAESGVTLAVVTSKAALYASRIVESLPFGARFERVYAVGPNSAHSEKASMIAQALADLGVAAHDAVMVGDRHFDIEGARANHVRAVGVTWGFGSREELRDAGADAIVDLPAQLVSSLLATSASARSIA